MRPLLQILSILEFDEVLAPLYAVAIRNSCIGPQRFENNFRGLLRSYARRLKEEALDSLEYLSARLVLSRARMLAIAIVEKHRNQASLQDVVKDRVIEGTTHEPEDIPEAEEENITGYEIVLADLARMRDFWIESSAFLTLRTELRKFVEDAKEYATQARPVVLDQPDRNQKSPIFQWAQQFIEAPFGLSTFILLLWGSKSPCPNGMENIEWQCVCNSYSDIKVSDLSNNLPRNAG